MRCTGPYTRVLFEASDAKSARALADGVRALGLALQVRHLPEGLDGLEDFALDLDFPAPGGPSDGSPSDGSTWELRCAKFLGPKKLLGHSHVYEVALRHRAHGGDIVWEGYLFATDLRALAKDLAATLPRVLAGERPGHVLDRDDAQLHRIELCTGVA